MGANYGKSLLKHKGLLSGDGTKPISPKLNSQFGHGFAPSRNHQRPILRPNSINKSCIEAEVAHKAAIKPSWQLILNAPWLATDVRKHILYSPGLQLSLHTLVILSHFFLKSNNIVLFSLQYTILYRMHSLPHLSFGLSVLAGYASAHGQVSGLMADGVL